MAHAVFATWDHCMSFLFSAHTIEMLIRPFAYSGVLLCNVLGLISDTYTMHNELHSQAEGVDLCTLYEFTFSILPSQ